MKKKGNKKMPRPRQEIIDNPIPTSLFMRLWVRVPLVELIFPSFFPFYLYSFPSDLRIHHHSISLPGV